MGLFRTICHQDRIKVWSVSRRYLTEDFGKWGAVYRQFRRWSVVGVWDALLDVLNATGMATSSVQMINSTIVRAHQHASGARRMLIRRVSGDREAVRRQDTSEDQFHRPAYRCHSVQRRSIRLQGI